MSIIIGYLIDKLFKFIISVRVEHIAIINKFRRFISCYKNIHEFEGLYNIRMSNSTVELRCKKCNKLCAFTFDEFARLFEGKYH